MTRHLVKGKRERNDPSHGRRIRLAVGRNTQGLEMAVSVLAVARDLAIIAIHDPSNCLRPCCESVKLLRFDITGSNKSALKQNK